MKYFKNIENGNIVSLSTGQGQKEITKDEYDNILSVVKTAPTADAGYRYDLKENLTWEKVKIEEGEQKWA